jgi:LCP family protein required for cell wall assembly
VRQKEQKASFSLRKRKTCRRAEELGIPHVYESPEAMLADPEIDIILNLTTPDVHAKYNLAALEAGKHVYSEKPLAATYEEGCAIMNLAAEKGLSVCCAPDTFMGGRVQEMRAAIDDGVIGRVNYIAKNYGPEALCQVLSQHMGVKIEKYIMFDFQQIANIVDYMGGVEIEVNASEARYLRDYPLDAHQTTPKMNRAGTYLFTGRAAVIYMRIRKAGGGGDFTRTQRARTVLSTLADKCRVMDYSQARALVDSVVENTTMTNMTLEDMVLAMEQAFSLRSCVIEELRIPQEDAVSPISYAGMSVQEIDWIKSREDVADYMECSWLVIDDEEYDD